MLTPKGITIPLAYQLQFYATNNISEYEALLAGLKLAYLLGARHLKIIGDSQLVLRQVLSTYRTRDPKLKPYQDLITLLAKQFLKLIYIHTSCSQNIVADALASLASSLSFPLSRSAETIIV